MNMREPVLSVEAARRQHLVDATIEALADVGFKAATLSQIAQRANVSTGLFAHYFGDKDGLLEATLRFMAVRLAQSMRRRLGEARDARERLYAVPDVALADEEFDRRTSAVWLAFWGQITHSSRYQRIQFIYQQRMLSNLRHDLRALVPADRVERYAAMIASSIDGVWVRSHASDRQADAAQARLLVRDLIDELIANAAGAAPIASDDKPVQRRPRPLGAARRRKIDGLVDSAMAAQRQWIDMSVDHRRQVLQRFSQAVRDEADHFAAIEAEDVGRPVALFHAHVMPRAARLLKVAAASVRGATVSCETLGGGTICEVHDAPLGVVATAVRPHAPFLDAVRIAGAHLCSGNSVVLQAPFGAGRGARRLEALLATSGAPSGLFHIVDADAASEAALREHSGIRWVEPPPERAATILLGTIDPVQAAKDVLHVRAPWQMSGDLSETRIFVARPCASAFLDALRREADALVCGDPRDPRVQIGAVRSGALATSIERRIDAALRAGGRLLRDGRAQAAGGVTIIEGGQHDDGGFGSAPLPAPIISVTVFDDEAALVSSLSISATAGFAGIGILGGDQVTARRISAIVCAPFVCIGRTESVPGAACAETFRIGTSGRRTRHVIVTGQ